MKADHFQNLLKVVLSEIEKCNSGSGRVLSEFFVTRSPLERGRDARLHEE